MLPQNLQFVCNGDGFAKKGMVYAAFLPQRKLMQVA